MARTILYDGDIALYHCCSAVRDYGFDIEEQPPHVKEVVEAAEPAALDITGAKRMFDYFIQGVMEKLGGDKVRVAFSDTADNGWRRKLVPSYKANRTAPKPVGFYEVRAYATEVYRGFLEPTLEADDLLGMWSTSTKLKGERIIVSDDKDFFSIPGLFYRPCDSDKGVQEISRESADRWHLLQTLMGDAVDGYPGLRGIGPVKANKILDEDCNWDRVVGAYGSHGLTEEDALSTARLARILRVGEYTRNKGVHLWKPTKRFTLYGTRKYGTGPPADYPGRSG